MRYDRGDSDQIEACSTITKVVGHIQRRPLEAPVNSGILKGSKITKRERGGQS